MNNTKKILCFLIALLALIIISMIIPTTTAATSSTQSANKVFLGLSGYPTSTTQIDNIIATMKANGMNTYRMSFNPTWSSGPHPFKMSYIQYFLDHCNYTIIVDRNHLYPPTETSAATARNNWAIVKSSIFEVLAAFPNNQRVMVELINEYVSSDFYSRMQSLVTEIRQAGYTNPIVVDKWNQPWTVINDPLGATYQGYHYYFNSWSPSGAISQIKTALSKGIQIINTEIGADYNEASSFTSSTVSEVTSFLSQCSALGVGNTIWMNENLNNWAKYQQLGLKIPSVTSPTSTGTVTPPAPTPSPTTQTISETFESGTLGSWSKTVTNGETAAISTLNPYQGNYDVLFTTTGLSYGRENAYITQSVNMQNVSVQGYFRISSSTGTILNDNDDRFYLIKLSDKNGELAYAGLRKENGIIKWVLYANGAKTSSAISASTDRYFNVELLWNSAQGTVQMFVDGTKILESTARSTTVTTINMGIIYTYNVQNPLKIYADNFRIASI